MAFDSLAEKFQNIFKNLRGKGRLSEADVKAAMKEVKLALLEASDKIKTIFQDLQEIWEDRLFHVRYGGVLPVPTGEDELFKVTITLFTYEWKGE